MSTPEDLEERLESTAEVLQHRMERLCDRLRTLESDLDYKVRDIEYQLEKAADRVRELERRVERGY